MPRTQLKSMRSVLDIRKDRRTFYHVVIELPQGLVIIANPSWPEERAPALEALALMVKELLELDNPEVASILEKHSVRFIPKGEEIDP